MGFQEVAIPGIILESGSICTSLSKMCSAMLLLGNRLKKCGSIDVMSAATAILRSAAAAPSDPKTKADDSATARSAWRRIGMRMDILGAGAVDGSGRNNQGL